MTKSSETRKWRSAAEKARVAYLLVPLSLKRFAVTGSLTVGLDAIVYGGLLHLGVPVDWAKGGGLVAATIFAYFANRFWAFDDATAKGNRFLSFLALYAAAVALNVAVNHGALVLLGQNRLAFFFSWFLATAASSSFNYVGMRFFVFRKQD